MSWSSVQGWVTRSSLVRRATEAVLASGGRRHLARLDRLAPDRCQRRILLGLVHQAQKTRFGIEHDFRRIRTIEDYRRLVPLSTRAELWRNYWQPVYPNLAGATWPGTSAAVQLAHRSALATALALATDARPRRRLLSGSLLLLADEGPPSRTEPAVLRERLPNLIRRYTDSRVEIDAEHFAYQPVTGLIGPLERLSVLLERVKQVRGKRCVRDIWPQLSAVFYTRRPSDGPASGLRTEIGDDVLQLEMVGRSEGPIAVHDPRHGLFRLLFDHGVYFEFVPSSQADDPHCPRLGIDEIELGVPYEMAVTSPAGLWACRLGRTICLERRDPPLLHFVETPLRKPAAPDLRRPVWSEGLLPRDPLQELHPQSADTPVALPETPFHSPWSILADRE